MARGKAIDIGFRLLLRAWQASQGARVSEIDIKAFEQKVASVYDEKTLALLWNYAALAYMLGAAWLATRLERPIWRAPPSTTSRLGSRRWE